MNNEIKSVLLDANCLLNSVFVEKSLAGAVIRIAIEERIQLRTCNEVIREAVRTLTKYSATNQLDRDSICRKLKAFIKAQHILITGGDFNPKVPGVKKHDMHVASASQLSRSPVLTTDIELYSSLLSQETPAITPLELWRLHRNDPFVFGVPFNSASGSIFSRFNSNQISSNDRSDFKATIFDIEGFGWHYFDRVSDAFMLVLDTGQTIKSNRMENKPHSFITNISWCNGEVHIDALGCDRTKPSLVSGPLLSGIAKFHLGCSRKIENHLNGYVRCIVFDDRPIGKEYWKKLRKTPLSVTPDPFDRDRLEKALIDEFGVFA